MNHTHYVPAAPLLAVIDSYDSLNDLPGMPGTRVSSEQPNGPLDPITGEPTSYRYVELVERTAEERRTWERVRRSVRRGRQAGVFGLHVADELAVDFLGMHPVEIYGAEFFEPELFACNQPASEEAA